MTSIQLSRWSSLLLAASLPVVDANANDGDNADQGQTDTVIVTVAGNGQPGYSGDGGHAMQAQLKHPHDVAIGHDGSLYIADTGNHCVRKVDPDGVIATIAGTGKRGYAGDGERAEQSQLDSPRSLAIGPDGSLFIADTKNHCIRKIDGHGVITTIAGTGRSGYSGDGGPATESQLNSPYGIAVGPDGKVSIADWANHRVRGISPRGDILTLAGTGVREGFEESHEGGAADRVPLPRPVAIAVRRRGDVYVGNMAVLGRFARQTCVLRIDEEGKCSRVAGVLSYGKFFDDRPLGDDGPAQEALLRGLRDVAVGPDGSLYIAHGFRIRQVGSDGMIRTVAGSNDPGNESSHIGDGGSPTKALLRNCSGLVIGGDGTIYLADTDHHRIRRVGAPSAGSEFAHRLPVTAEAGDTVVRLTWAPPVDKSVKAYLIYRGQSRRWLAETKEPAFEDIGLSNGQSYTYHVTAVLKDGEEFPIYATVAVTIDR